jgi:hypothetical protein
MSPTSIGVGYRLIYSTGSEHISRLVETRKGKKIFLQPKNFLLMRYNNKKKYLVN